jgi:hypothetical protein
LSCLLIPTNVSRFELQDRSFKEKRYIGVRIAFVLSTNSYIYK